jgi:hypothetical protein
VRIRNIEASAEAMLRTFADQERDAQFYVVMDLSIGRTQSVSGLFAKVRSMHSVIYLVGLVVVLLFILSVLGLR